MAHNGCTGGITGYIDRLILREQHLFQWSYITSIYSAQAFDPEGLFGCLPTIFQTFLGVHCGVILQVYSEHKDRQIRWTIWAVFFGAITAAFTLGTVHDGVININKHLWSLSFVTLTTSGAYLFFGIIYLLVDVKNIGSDVWTIFLYPGMNAIFLYIGHMVFHTTWPFNFALDVMNTHFILLLENVYTTTVWILIAHWLYHKKIFYNL